MTVPQAVGSLKFGVHAVPKHSSENGNKGLAVLMTLLAA